MFFTAVAIKESQGEMHSPVRGCIPKPSPLTKQWLTFGLSSGIYHLPDEAALEDAAAAGAGALLLPGLLRAASTF